MDEFDMLQGRVLLGGHHQSGAARQAGEQRGRLGENIFQAPAAACHACLDHSALLRFQIAHFQKPVHEQTQAFFRGHASRAGVRGIEQAHALQVCHHIADGGGRQGQRQALGEGARAHWLARGQKGFHQMTEDFPRAFAQGRIGETAGERIQV
jgi:hypothetical protein